MEALRGDVVQLQELRRKGDVGFPLLRQLQCISPLCRVGNTLKAYVIGDAVSELLRQLQYNLPSPRPSGSGLLLPLPFAWLGGSRSSITSPRSSPAAAKGARVEGGKGGGGGLVLLPRDLNRMRSLSQLLRVLDPFVEGARGVGGGGGGAGAWE